MATLYGQLIKDTYEGLLKFTDNDIVSGTKKRITDGLGNDTSILISDDAFEVDSFMYVNKNAVASLSKLGLNISSPLAMLHVQIDSVSSTIDSNAIAVFEKSGDASVQFLSGNAGTFNLMFGDDTQPNRGRIAYSHANNEFKFYTDNATVMTLTSTRYVGINEQTPTQRLHVDGNLRVTGAYYDSNNTSGTSGQILSSTGTGTDWVSISEISGVDGTGNANYVAKWLDTDTITDSQIYDNGTNVGIGNALPSQKLTVSGNAYVTGAYYDSNNSPGTSGQILSSTATGTDWIAAPSGTVDGSGTANYFPLWSDADTLTDSVVYQSGSDIYIPQNIVHIGDTDSYFGFASADFVQFRLAGASEFAIYSGGVRVYNTLRLDGAVQDSLVSTGTSGQVLSSTGSATQWIDQTTGIDGSGSATKLAIWSDVDTITYDANLYFNSTIGALYIDNVIYSANDLDTGLSFPGGNILKLVTGGTTRLGLTSTDITASLPFIFDSSIELNSTLIDINGSTGTSGQILSSTGSGVDWIDSPTDNNWYVTGATFSTTTGVLSITGNNAAVGATVDLDGRYVESVSQGAGITVSGTTAVTVTNSDRGSSQNIFKNVAVSGQSTIVADSNNDTLTVAAGSGISLTTDAATDTLTITNTGTGLTGTGVATKLAIWNGTDSLSYDANLYFAASTGSLYIDDVIFSANDLDTGVSWSGGDILKLVTGGTTRLALTSTNITSTLPFVFDSSIELNSTLIDINGNVGTSGQILSSTGTGVDWIDATGGIDGSGTANYVTKWIDSDTIGNSIIYDNGSSVGIGTASPHVTNKLEVSGQARVYGQMMIGNSSTSNAAGATLHLKNSGAAVLRLEDSDSANLYYDIKSDFGNGLIISEGSSERMRIDTSGNVGIGTTSPSYKLTVDDDTPYGGIMIQGGNAPALTLLDESGTAKNLIYAQSTSSAQGILRLSADDNNTGTDSSIEFRVDGAEKMRITSGGNVGIGTTSPQAKLSVDGGADNLLATFKSTDDLAYISFQDNNTTSNTSVALGANDNNLVFFTGTSFGSERMRITSGGNVGIGTTSPAEKLDVEGTSRFNGDMHFGSNTDGLIYRPVESGSAIDRYFLMFDETNNASYPFLTNRTPSGAVVIKTGTAAAGGENEHFRIEGGDGTVDAYFTNANVGIGTTSPDAKLHVESTSATGANFILETTHSGGIPLLDLKGAHSAQLRYKDELDVIQGRIDFGDSGTFNFIDVPNNNSTLYLKTGGNVGIGTTSPSYKLSVNGNIQTDIINGYTYPNNSWLDFDYDQTLASNMVALASIGTIVYLADTNNNASSGAPAHLFTTASGDVDSATRLLNINTNGEIQFNQYGSGTFTGTATQRLGVDSSGNVIEIPIGSGPVDGSGTANYVTKWTDADTIGNSIIYDNGINVGVGTTSPKQLFHIHGGSTSGSVTKAVIGGTGGNGESYLYLAENFSGDNVNYGFSFVADGNSSNNLLIKRHSNSTSGNTVITVNRDNDNVTFAGNVGIGTTSPQRNLTIYEYSGNSVLQLANNISGVGGSDGFLAYTDGVNVGLENKENGYLSLATNATERMRIASNGNVGIGTTNPGVKLQVNGGIRAFGTTSTTGQIDASPDFGAFRFYNGNTFRGGLGTGQWAGVGNSTDIVQYLNNVNYYISNGTTALVKVELGGNVGIGTTDPDSKFQVNVGTDQNIGINSHSGIARISSYNDAFTASSPLKINGSELRFDINSVEKMRINSSGNIGIGTTTPGYKLDVAGNFRAKAGSSAIAFEEYNSGATLWFDGSDGDFVGGDYFNISAYGTTDLAFGYAATTKMVMKSTGNVGIGTTSPGYKLDVTGGSNSQFRITANDSNPTTIVMDTTTGSTDRIRLKNEAGVFKLAVQNTTDALVVNTSGNVGIGTTSPSHKLDINSGTATSGFRLIGSNSSYTGAFIANTGTGGASLYFDASDGDFSGGDYMVIRQLNSLRGEISMSSNTPAFDISMADVPKFTVLQNGNVGIGTTSPSQKLQVEGNSWIKGIYYDTSGDAGTSGQVLSSTATGTTWIDAKTQEIVSAIIAYKTPGAQTNYLTWLAGAYQSSLDGSTYKIAVEDGSLDKIKVMSTVSVTGVSLELYKTSAPTSPIWTSGNFNLTANTVYSISPSGASFSENDVLYLSISTPASATILYNFELKFLY